MKIFLQKLLSSSPWLFNLSIILTVLSVFTLAGVGLDDRLVTGVNPWIKPIKFDLSIVIFALTVAWILQFISKQDAARIGQRMAICLSLEIVLIYLQAARGVTSHFNFSSPFNMAIFTIMGLSILYNTILIYQTLRLISQNNDLNLASPQKLSIEYGLISLLIGSFMGGYMSAQKGHTVGGTDGGPGLPFVNWSTQFGDLRVAHFVGLHGVQFFLMLGWLLLYWPKPISEPRQKVLLQIAFACFLVLVTDLFVQALLAHPVSLGFAKN